LRWLESAHRLRPAERETDSWVGYALVEHDLDLRRGVRLLHRALARNPKDWRALADLALAQLKLGDRAEAEVLAKRAKQAAPRDAEIRRQVGLVLGIATKGRRAPRLMHRERQ
jgi:Flp pilus assembly protein TadD